MGLSELRDNFSESVVRAQMGIPTIGTNRGKPIVAIVPVEVLNEYIENEQRELREMIRGRQNEDTTDLTAELNAITDKLAPTDRS